MNVYKLKKGDLVWFFGKLMYFEKREAGKFVFSVPASNAKSGYAKKTINKNDLIAYGSL